MKSVFFITLVIVWVSLVYWVSGGIPPVVYNGQRFFSLIFLSLAALFGLFVRSPPMTHWLRAGLSGLLILALILLWVDERHWHSIRELMLVVLILLAARFIASVRYYQGSVFDGPAATGLLLLCLGVGLIVLQSLLLYLPMGYLNWALIFEAFLNVRIFSHIQSWTLLLLPALVLMAPTSRMTRLAWLAASLWWFVFLLSGTRSVLVATGVALLVTGVLFFRQSRQWWMTLGKMMLAGVGIYGIFRFALYAMGMGMPANLEFFRVPSGKAVANEDVVLGVSSSGRLDIWQHAWEQFLTSPWTGVSTQFFPCSSLFKVSTEHNVLFTLLVGWGGVLTLTAVLLVLVIYFKFINTAKNRMQNRPLAISLVAVWTTVLVDSLFTGVYLSPISQMLTALILGWSWGIAASCQPPAGITRNTLQPGWLFQGRLLVVLLTLSVLAGVLFMLAVDIHMQHSLIFQGNRIMLNFNPRIWAMGGDWCH